ncbi:molybdate ABC transporter substrate-binding protein [Ferdinandcohnia sp. Marseille-Q9671]
MYKKVLLFVLIFFLSGCGTSPENNDKEDLTVSAAASMQNALQEIKDSFEKQYPTIRIDFNFGASGALAQQISQGAPVDLFLSASLEKFDALVDEGFVHEEYQRNLIGNEIVVIVPRTSERNITSMEEMKTKAERISIGIPESVPVGKYAKETLVNQGVWHEVENKIIYAKDVRQVLTYVETGNVDAGIVYQTDAKLSDQIKIVDRIESSLHSAVIYPIGIMKSSKHISEAKLFYEYLSSDEAVTVFEEYGFKRVN